MLKLTRNMSVKKDVLNSNLIRVKKEVYDVCFSRPISKVENEQEGVVYDACKFTLNNFKIISRSSKITPKKVGQFVTFWKRNKEGVTVPYSETDLFDYYVINVKSENNFGQFVFPKSELVSRGIVSTKTKEGKRGFRVYPKWDIVKSKQAIKTQKWQLNYFYEIGLTSSLEKAKVLYGI